MPYARVHMVEWETNNLMRKHYADMHQIVKNLFPEITAFFQVETSETSSLVISVYKDEAAAERALQQRDAWHKNKPFKDILGMLASWVRITSNKGKLIYGIINKQKTGS